MQCHHNKGERLGSTLNPARTRGDSQPRSRVRGLMDGKSQRGDINGRVLLLKQQEIRPRPTYQRWGIRKLVRYQRGSDVKRGRGFSINWPGRILDNIGLCRPKTEWGGGREPPVRGRFTGA